MRGKKCYVNLSVQQASVYFLQGDKGGFRVFRAHEKGTSLSTCTKAVMEAFSLENSQQEDMRLEVTSMRTFVKVLIKDVLEHVGVCISPSKRGKEK